MGEDLPQKRTVPGHIFIGYIQKYKEALIIGSISLMCLVHGAHSFHFHQINHMDVYLLGNRRRVERIFYGVVLWPLSAVHIQVPVEIYVHVIIQST